MFFRGSIMEKHIMEWLFCSRTWLRNLGMFKTARIRQYKWTQSILQCLHHLCRADFQPTTHHDCPACPQHADLRTIGLCPLRWKQLGSNLRSLQHLLNKEWAISQGAFLPEELISTKHWEAASPHNIGHGEVHGEETGLELFPMKRCFIHARKPR